MRKRLIILMALLVYLITNTPYDVHAGTNTPLRRPISPNQPMWLIHIDTWNWADPQKIIDLIPSDIRPYVVFNISLSISHDASCAFNIVQYGYETAKSWVRTCAENQVWCMIQPSSGGFSHFSDFDLTVYREFFQSFPNFLGFNYCEQFWGFDDPCSVTWFERVAHWVNLINLADEFGGYLVVSFTGGYWGASLNPVAMMKRNPDFASVCSQKSDHFIICEKFTSNYGYHDIESTSLGCYLSGYAGQYGIRFDQSGWYPNASEDFPVASGAAPVIEHIMLTGETVIDGPELIWQQCIRGLSDGTTPDGYTTRRWEFYPQFPNISIDIFRKILDGTIRIMSRREVIDRTKVVIINDITSGDDRTLYHSPETLFSGLYLMSGDGTYLNQHSWFKRTGRYPSIPTVYQLNGADPNSFQVKVNRSAYSTRWPNTTTKVNEFNSLFPPEYSGTIYAGRHENGWVTYNPFKTGQTAGGYITFKYNTCAGMNLAYSQYTVGVIKEYSDKLTFYLTNFDNSNESLKTDMIKINGCSSEPSYSFTDRGNHIASIITKSWSDSALTLTIEHNGALDITVNCSGSAAGRLTSYTTATITAPIRPPVYRGERQYEAENWDFKIIDKNVTNGVGQGVSNYTGQGYMQFGTTSVARIRDTVTVQNSGIYNLATKYSTTGGNVTTIDLYVNGTKVSTPAFTQTASYSAWAVNNQNISLNAGSNTIEFRANAAGAHNIYFDNMVIGSDNSDDIWLEAECATVGENWDILKDANASNGYYVTVKPGKKSIDEAPAGDEGAIFISYYVNISDNYTVFARLNCPTDDDDSFWVKMDNEAFRMKSELVTNGWEWIKLDEYALTKGVHTLAVAYRKDGAKLDKIYISNHPVTPSGKGEKAENLCDPSGEMNSGGIPEEYVLEQNYPNPFNHSTTIEYRIPVSCQVSIKVFNIMGQEITSLVDGIQESGYYKILWNGTSNTDKPVSSGLYIIRMDTGVVSKSRKIILIK